MRVLLVCLGNICRSPTAEAVLRSLAELRGLSDQLYLDSCGTGDWHVGKSPDARAVAAAAKRGYDMSMLRARQLAADDFSSFDLILAMDDANLADIRARARNACVETAKFLDYLPAHTGRDVPDPYYGGQDGFDRVLDLVEQGSDAILDQLFPEAR